MKLSLPAIFFAVVSAPVLSADVLNKVTISGSAIAASEPVVKESAQSYSSVSRLAKVGVTNSTVLDLMISLEALSTKSGYALVERFDNEGTTRGYFAYNKKSGHLVAVPEMILTACSNATGAVAQSRSMKRSATGINDSITRAFSTTGTASISQAALACFIDGSMATKPRNFTVEGVKMTEYHFLPTYTATMRGALNEGSGTVQLKVTSNGGSYYSENGPISSLSELGLTKSGSGTLTLSGSNQSVGSVGILPTGTTLTVLIGVTLGGDGTILFVEKP